MKIASPTLTLGQVQKLLDLDYETGTLRWTAAAAHGRLTHRVAGSHQAGGYLQVKIGKRVYLAHRIVWLLAFGAWPEAPIDHIDGDRKNNAPLNLRLANASQNAQNRGRKIKSATGIMGVIHVPETSRRRERWVSRIKLDGQSKWLGSFTDPESAEKAYLAAKVAVHPYSARFAE